MPFIWKDYITKKSGRNEKSSRSGFFVYKSRRKAGRHFQIFVKRWQAMYIRAKNLPQRLKNLRKKVDICFILVYNLDRKVWLCAERKDGRKE